MDQEKGRVSRVNCYMVAQTPAADWATSEAPIIEDRILEQLTKEALEERIEMLEARLTRAEKTRVKSRSTKAPRKIILEDE